MTYLLPIPVGATTKTSAPCMAASMISFCLPRKDGLPKATRDGRFIDHGVSATIDGKLRKLIMLESGGLLVVKTRRQSS